MEQRKQTAVEFLIDNIYLLNSLKWNDIIDQAKQMEKEQIKEAYVDGCIGEKYELSATYTAEEYYNKTYANDTTKGLPEEDSKRRAWHY